MAAAIEAGRSGHVTTLDGAADVLRRLGVDEHVVRWRLGVLDRQLASLSGGHRIAGG